MIYISSTEHVFFFFTLRKLLINDNHTNRPLFPVNYSLTSLAEKRKKRRREEKLQNKTHRISQGHNTNSVCVYRILKKIIENLVINRKSQRGGNSYLILFILLCSISLIPFWSSLAQCYIHLSYHVAIVSN